MSLKSFLLDLLFPITCLNCRQEGSCLCDVCFSRLKLNQKTYPLNTPNLKKIFIAGDYDDQLLKKLIKQFKFNSLEAIGPILGRFLCTFWQLSIIQQTNLKLSKKILIVPIPLSKKRYYFRGFNQAEILARYFSNFFSYELSLNLKRVKHRRPQSSLDEMSRAKNIKDVFVWQKAHPEGDFDLDCPIILIDDVVTTGATLNEAALTIKKTGAQEIYGLVLAKG